MNYATGIPKGRAMRASVAAAIKIETIAGVRRVIADQFDDVVYVQCTPAAWADIQARGAKFTGVEHTGEVRRQWLANRDEVWLSELREQFGGYTVALVCTADGVSAFERTTADLQLALRWQHWFLIVQDRTLAKQILLENPVQFCSIMDVGVKLWGDETHEDWVRMHPLPRPQ